MLNMSEIKTFEERKKELIKIGKEKGYITFEELADHLRGLDMDSDSLDELYNAFHDMGIDVVSEDQDDSEDVSGGEVIGDLSIPKTVSINDPVRMYLNRPIRSRTDSFTNSSMPMPSFNALTVDW